ncbi:MAG: hypothetical protein IPG96_08835 [Proteobacteria bacterium]|nr:hypothetical protein [Pseudomonadota bacterium]
MQSTFPRVYRSFEDFERNELRKLDSLYGSVDDMVDELVLAELDDDGGRGDDDGILFDRVDD